MKIFIVAVLGLFLTLSFQPMAFAQPPKSSAKKIPITQKKAPAKSEDANTDDCAEAKACTGVECAQSQCTGPEIDDPKKSSDDDDPVDPKFEDQGFDEE